MPARYRGHPGSMRDHLLLTINGNQHRIAGRDAFLTLADFLRRRLGLIGSKIVCSEGDCGACTVLVGRRIHAGQQRAFRPIDSCIAFVFQLDGAHVITIEGLTQAGELNAVQQAMIECHGSQCGFCTPGFVVQMTALRDEAQHLDAERLRSGLTGNLCRCTGYVPILEAGLAAAGRDEDCSVAQLYPEAPDGDAANGAPDGEICVTATAYDQSPLVAHCPATLAGALKCLSAHPDAVIVAGATDVGVRVNKSGRLPSPIIDLNRIAELDYVRCDETAVVAGARASWTALEEAFESLVPEFHAIVTRFGAPQIRHAGTIGGNIANASPIADCLPFLFVMEASLKLQCLGGERTAPITGFYHGYKQLELKPGELITEVRIPLPEADERLRLYKVSRRRDLDIASFTAAVRIRLEDGVIADAKIAFGAVGPTVIRAERTEQFLMGQPFTKSVMTAAGEEAVDEVAPISDVRGSTDYRLQLTRNILLKFYHQNAAPALPA